MSNSLDDDAWGWCKGCRMLTPLDDGGDLAPHWYDDPDRNGLHSSKQGNRQSKKFPCGKEGLEPNKPPQGEDPASWQRYLDDNAVDHNTLPAPKDSHDRLGEEE